MHKKRWEKNPRVRKIRVRNSGAGNGCANFMDTWKKCVLSAGKTMSVKFPFFGGGLGGGSADFIFMGARIFLIYRGPRTTHHRHIRPSSSGGIFGGVVCELRNLRKRQTTHHPQFCTRDIDRRFCGGGAWNSRPEFKQELANFSREFSRERAEFKRKLAASKPIMPGFGQLYPGNRRNKFTVLRLTTEYRRIAALSSRKMQQSQVLLQKNREKPRKARGPYETS